MLLKLVLVLSLSLLVWAMDKTVEPGTKSEDVVCEVIKKIDDSGIFADDKKMLRRIAYVESKFGEDNDTYRRDYHGGIWQVDEIGFKDAIIGGSHPNLDKIWPQISKLLNKRKEDIKWTDLGRPLFSGVFARIRLYLVNSAIPNDLTEQAKYWKKYYNTEAGKGTVEDYINRANEMNEKFGSDCNVCQGRMNLAIIMDGSGSIGSKNYKYAKEAAENLIGTFSNTSVDVGYVLFSSTVDILFPLKSNLTRDQMKKKIENSPYPNGSTRTDLAIDAGVTVLEKADDSTGIPRVMVIFTDGNPDNVDNAKSAAERAKELGIIIFAVAIGNSIDEKNLKDMASKDSYVLPVGSYLELTQFFEKINSKTCSVPQTPAVGIPVENDQLLKKEKRYFKFEVPNEGITIKIDVSYGKTQGYIVTIAYGSVWSCPNFFVLASKDTPFKFGPLTTSEAALFTAIPCVGLIIGILLYTFIIDRLDRSALLFSIAIPLLLNWTALLLAENVYHLLIARICCGFAGGVMIITLVGNESENLLSSSVILAANFGVLMGFVLTNFFNYVEQIQVNVILLILFIIVFCIEYVPEPPETSQKWKQTFAIDNSISLVIVKANEWDITCLQKATKLFAIILVILMNQIYGAISISSDVSLTTASIVIITVQLFANCGTMAVINRSE